MHNNILLERLMREIRRQNARLEVRELYSKQTHILCT
jgi:hypothetical protein